MPKKRTFNFKQLHGSGPTQSSGSNVADRHTTSVNERLNELRRLGGKEAAQKKQELAEAITSNQRSVPPSVRGVLGISEGTPPAPKRGLRARNPNRTPGPAPPQSWLRSAASIPPLTLRGNSLSKTKAADRDRDRPKRLLRFDRMTGLEDRDPDEKPASLLHISLKTAAEHWDLFDDADLPALADLPLRLRLRLLSYLAFYGPPIGIAVLRALIQGSEPVTHIDLGGMAGTRTLPFSRLAKFAKSQPTNITTTSNLDLVLDSWDEDGSFETALTPQRSLSYFPHLTHLCISHPGAGASWRDLLEFSKHIPTITHLSLAYWPRPTLTPNLATATVSSQHSPDVTAGGSHYYSGLDDDLSEPASILRQLSGHFLRLQWLDLEGCADWLPALSFHNEGVATSSLRGRDNNTWSITPNVASIFIHNWKNLQYLNFSQGWQPTLGGLRALPRQTMAPCRSRIVQDFMSQFDAFEVWKLQGTEDIYSLEKRKAEMWLQLEEKAFTTCDRIHSIRRANACRPIDIDHGWKPIRI